MTHVLAEYFAFYNRERLHLGLEYQTPLEVLEETPRTNREGTGNGPLLPAPLDSNPGGGKDTQTISLKTASIGRTDGEHLIAIARNVKALWNDW